MVVFIYVFWFGLSRRALEQAGVFVPKPVCPTCVHVRV